MRTTCLASIFELAKCDPRIVFLGSDIGHGLIDDYRKELPDQFSLEGISEQNLVGVAAGMAREGKTVYLAMIASFLSRAYEQIKLDVALHNLPVRLVGFGGGLMYSHEGPTHTATDDIALMRNLGITCICPADRREMAALMPQTVDYPGPLYIRLGWGEPILPVEVSPDPKEAYDILFISTGNITAECIKAKDILKAQGLKALVWHHGAFNNATDFSAYPAKLMVAVEEGILNGGFGWLVAAKRQDKGITAYFGLPIFPEGYGSRLEMLERYGLTGPQIAAKVKEIYDSL